MTVGTGEDGADLGPRLLLLCEVFDTPERERPAILDENLVWCLTNSIN